MSVALFGEKPGLHVTLAHTRTGLRFRVQGFSKIWVLLHGLKKFKYIRRGVKPLKLKRPSNKNGHTLLVPNRCFEAWDLGCT